MLVNLPKLLTKLKNVSAKNDFSKLKKYDNRFDEIIVKVRYVTT